ncbi:hypothetical protein Vadar_018321 [Vaccinium darrowii]|uniref:Uncharacterized protein n=1 Tax=Vaccinium darrowii TaxID=229202 RepID=A0ACB7Y7M3_9ERIC|nr:hypothetical protein Vadar_018321 [Vaccinium darrowii]
MAPRKPSSSAKGKGAASSSAPPEQKEGGSPVQGRVLDRRMVKRGNKAVVQWLVQWLNSFPEDATWVDYQEIKSKYPQFHP